MPEEIATQITMVPLDWYLYLSVALFSLGAIGVMLRRNAIIILMCIELMLNSVNLLLVAFSAYNNHSDGQLMVLFIMVVAAAEVAVGLSLIISIYRNTSGTDINILNKLKW